MIENTIGLEAEFFLRNKKNELVLPKDYRLPCDDFILLGECRGEPSNTREGAVSNFLREYYRIEFLCDKQELKMDVVNGWTKLDPKFYTFVVKKMGQKEVPKCENIYDTDLMNYSDSIVEEGKVIAHKVSIGLHVHFSAVVKDTKDFLEKKYESVNLPLQISPSFETSLNLFAERGEKKTRVECKCSRITKPVIRYVVERMDKEIYPQFKIEEPLRYRLPGFYESKEDGRFEYRSLPFNEKILQSIPKITDFAFGLLESL